MKIPLIIIGAVACLVLAYFGLQAPNDTQVIACMDASNMTYTQCQNALER